MRKYLPYRNQPKTPAKVTGRIVIDLMKYYNEDRKEINVNSGVTVSPPVTVITGMDNPMTTLGDIIYAMETATPATPERLGIGAAGDVLTVVAGIPAWVTLRMTSAETTVNRGSAIASITVGAISDTSDKWKCTATYRVDGSDMIKMVSDIPLPNTINVIGWEKVGGNLICYIKNDTSQNLEVIVWAEHDLS